MGFFRKKHTRPANGKPTEAVRQAMLANEQHRHYSNNVKSYTGGKFAYEKSAGVEPKKSKRWIAGSLLAAVAVIGLIALPDPPSSEVVPEVTTAIIADITVPATETVHIHTFLPATCTQAQTCADCGQTEGSALGHEYTSGVCSLCLQEEITVWIPRTGDRYHSSADCSNMIEPSNVPLSEAIALGFTPCSHCYS